jgi:UDP-glucose 4-epimerase
MRVLITGAGLIGCHTAREMVERGDDVTFLDVAPRPDHIRHVVGKDLPLIRGDIRDLPCLVDAMRDVRPDCVIHLAALVGEVNIPNLYTGFKSTWRAP